jgi:hypothetical protein
MHASVTANERRAYGCLERHHDVSTEVHILEHAFQLVSELAAALCLQFGDHVLLCVCTGTASQQQPLRQILLVEGLEHVLALHSHNARLSGQVVLVEGLNARLSGQILLVKDLKHIFALQVQNARMSGQILLVEGLKHVLAVQSHNARLSGHRLAA